MDFTAPFLESGAPPINSHPFTFCIHSVFLKFQNGAPPINSHPFTFCIHTVVLKFQNGAPPGNSHQFTFCIHSVFLKFQNGAPPINSHSFIFFLKLQNGTPYKFSSIHFFLGIAKWCTSMVLQLFSFLEISKLYSAYNFSSIYFS